MSSSRPSEPDAELREAEQSIRTRDSNYFAERCRQWVDQANIPDDFVVAAVGPYHPTKVAEVAAQLAKIEYCDDEWQRLCAIEVLGDMIGTMQEQRRLRDRTPPTDALGVYLHDGLITRRVCRNHPERYGAFSDGDTYLCAHCVCEDGAGSGN